MKVRILQSIVGQTEPIAGQPGFRFSYYPGDTPDVEDATAVDWIQRGIAEPIGAAPRETAVLPAAKGKLRKEKR